MAERIVRARSERRKGGGGPDRGRRSAVPRRLADVEAAAAVEARGEANTLTMLRRCPVDRARLDARQLELVDRARTHGVGWGVIGAALGVSPQAVRKRYGLVAAPGLPPCPAGVHDITDACVAHLYPDGDA